MRTVPLFHDRADAGRQLVAPLQHYAQQPQTLLLALPRGGVVVAFEVARQLRLALDVLLVRKLGVPGQEELALGAIASGGIRVLNPDIIQKLGLSLSAIDAVTNREQRELDRRERAYRGSRPAVAIAQKTVILIDDGLATGATMRAAIRAVRTQHPTEVVLAVPVAAESTCRAFRELADEVICLATPESFSGVGQWYAHFDQTTDAEVRQLLRQAAGPA